MTKTIRTPKEGNVFIATYGSLRRGMGNHRVNEMGSGEFVSCGKTVNNYNLYHYMDWCYPSVSLTHNSHETRVVVDVVEAPESGLLGAYDSLEGCRGHNYERNFYNRTIIEVELDDGSFVDCWIYHIDEEQTLPVKAGDWCIEMEGEDYYATV